MDLMLLVEDQKEKKEKAIQNVYHLQKLGQCQKVKDVQQSQEKELQEIQDPKPKNVATFTKRKRAADGGYIGPAINSVYDGVTLNNRNDIMGDIALRGKGRALKNCAGRDPECKFSLKIRDKFAKGSTPAWQRKEGKSESGGIK
jgi:hypothetical protein